MMVRVPMTENDLTHMESATRDTVASRRTAGGRVFPVSSVDSGKAPS